MKPGVYTAKTGDPDLGLLLAMVEAGDATSLGEFYDEAGDKNVAVEVGGLRRNAEDEEVLGSVGFTLGEEWFTNILRDYQDNFGEKWWREAIQNGVDAGATRINCTQVHRDDGNVDVTCEDNGSGMSRDVLVGAMLTGGGTTKVGVSTFGGFGRAKELLLLPWMRYEIHTRDLIVASRNAEPAPLRKTTNRKGTRLTVTMPSDKHADIVDAVAYIARCDLPNVRLYCNGEYVRADLGRKSDPIRVFEHGHFRIKVYYDKKNTQHPYYALVRLNGLFMFQQWVSGKPRGLLLVEIEGAAKDVLTSNRDAFADASVRREIDQFLQEVSREKEQALRSEKGLFKKAYVGREQFRAELEERERERHAAFMERMGGLRPDQKGEIPSGALGELVELANVLVQGGYVAGVETRVIGSTSAGLTQAMLNGLKVAGTDQMETIATQLAWEPDLFLENDIEGFKVPRKFFPESMTSSVRRLLKLWAELCRFVMMQLNCPKPFGVGFIFSRERLGQYTHEDDRDWLMLNPLPMMSKWEDDAPMLDMNKNLYDIYAIAVHEATHMADNVGDHDVSFAAALTKNIALTYGKDKHIRAIKREVIAYDKEVLGKLREGKPSATKAPRGSRTKEELLQSLLLVSGPGYRAGTRALVFATWTLDDHHPVIVRMMEQPPEAGRETTWKAAAVQQNESGKFWYSSWDNFGQGRDHWTEHDWILLAKRITDEYRAEDAFSNTGWMKNSDDLWSYPYTEDSVRDLWEIDLKETLAAVREALSQYRGD